MADAVNLGAAATTTTATSAATPAPSPDASSPATQSSAALALSEFVRQRYSDLAADRFGEDYCWYKSGLFNNGYHWLKSGQAPSSSLASAGRSIAVPMTRDDYRPGWTAPVTDHYSKTIAANANSLGARLPRVTALSGNYDARSRRAASYAEAVFDTANRESGMDVLNPILAQHVPLWGIGWTKDSVAFDLSVEDVPVLADGQTEPSSASLGPGPGDPAAPAPESVDPQSGDPVDSAAPEVIGTERVPAPRLKTTIPSPFSVYLPRDCGDPNLSPELYERVVWRLGEARQAFPDYADQLRGDSTGTDSRAAQGDTSLAAYFELQLQRLGGTSLSSGSGRTTPSTATSSSSGGSEDTTVQFLTAIEAWIDWATLPKRAQDALEAEWGDSPSVVEEYATRGMTRLSAAIAYGVYAIVWQSLVLQYGENPNHGDTPHTAFMWEKNALNPYGQMGLGRVLMPLQRQLNQLDAIHARQLLSNGTTKILMPESQQFDPPGGDPIDIFRYDDMAGKTQPTLFPAGNAGGIPAKREQIVAEFAQLGYTEGVQAGNAPGGVDSFRGIAYLGAKAEEARGTQRALWEQSHERRSRKLLRLARRVWTEPRKIKVAGPNNRYGAELIEGADLDFETDQITIVEGSSKPKTLQDKLEALQTISQIPGLVDPSDPDFKQIVLDSIGMPEVSINQSLQYAKADRDLQQVLDGIQPVSSPAQDWTIVIRTFSQYTLTEEYEGLDADKQAGILGYIAWAQALIAPPPMPMPIMPGTGAPGQPPAPGGGPSNPLAALPSPTANPGGTLSKTPGKTAPTKSAETAATSEGNSVASAVDNSPSPFRL